jgi:DNA-binding NtrC family response regulator
MDDVKHILLVDDDELICRVINRCIDAFFKEKIIKVSYAMSAGKGVFVLNMHPGKYDLVITDWDCPESNAGMHIINCAQLKFGIPVIVNTGDVLAVKRYLGEQHIDQYFSPPILSKGDDIQILMEEINGILYE